MKSIFEIKCNQIVYGSLLIPRKELCSFLAQRRKVGSSRKMLRYFLLKYSNQILNVKIKRGICCKYQNSGQDLEKINFSPEADDWMKLKTLAFYRGVSMTWLFMWMLGMEEAGVERVHAKFPSLIITIYNPPSKPIPIFRVKLVT